MLFVFVVGSCSLAFILATFVLWPDSGLFVYVILLLNGFFITAIAVSFLLHHFSLDSDRNLHRRAIA